FSRHGRQQLRRISRLKAGELVDRRPRNLQFRSARAQRRHKAEVIAEYSQAPAFAHAGLLSKVFSNDGDTPRAGSMPAALHSFSKMRRPVSSKIGRAS